MALNLMFQQSSESKVENTTASSRFRNIPEDAPIRVKGRHGGIVVRIVFTVRTFMN